MSHTPTPWQSRVNAIYRPPENDGGESISIATTSTMGSFNKVSPAVRAANAAHIVKCVNMHDDLVDVLSWVLRSVRMRGPAGTTGYVIGEDYIARAKELIEQAKETT